MRMLALLYLREKQRTPLATPGGLDSGFPLLDCYPSKHFWFFGESRQFPGAPSSLRVAGLEEVLDESCGSDVEDELAPEFDDNPEMTMGTKFSVFHIILCPCLVRCGF